MSTDGQARDGYGLDVQKRDVRAWARRNGHKLIRIETDPGLSGTLPDTERPALLAALKAVRDHEADGIIIPSLHRLARLLHQQEAILAQLWKLGGTLYAVDAGEILPDDPDDPMRTAMRQMMGVSAQLDRAMLIKRMRNGRASKHELGGYAGYGSPPYGWRSIGKELVPDWDEQAIVTRMRTMRAKGASARSPTHSTPTGRRRNAASAGTLRRSSASSSAAHRPPKSRVSRTGSSSKTRGETRSQAPGDSAPAA